MAVSSSSRACASAFAALTLGVAAPVAAYAQMMHGMTPGPPALEERVARADAAAVATVEAVEAGRIRLRDGVAVFGTVPDAFEVKRRPSAPLGLAVGERALLLLAGARSPYVVVDDPKDVAPLADAAAASRRADAVRDVYAARGDVEALRAVYIGWTEADDEALRAEALRSLLRFGGPFLPVPPESASARAQVALDATRSPAARRAAAALAAGDPAALDRMLTGVFSSEVAADPELALAIVRSGLLRSRPAAPHALLVALRSSGTDLRLGALEIVREAPPAVVAPALADLAANDPDARVREQAAHALSRLRPEGVAAP